MSSDQKKLKIAITGATGFLGAAVTRALVGFPVELILVSRSAESGYYQVSDYSETPAADVLIHLAEDSDRARVNAGDETVELAALQTLEALIAKRYERIIYASSAVLYGDKDLVPHKTSDEIYIVDRYSRIKARSEELLLSAGKNIVCRLVNLYGPRMAKINVINTILQQLSGEGPLKLWDSAPIRDFLWINDAATAIANMVVGNGLGIYNVGSGLGVSIGELAQKILSLAGQNSREIEVTKPSSRASCITVDIAETIKVWDWRPVVDLEQGLQKLVK